MKTCPAYPDQRWDVSLCKKGGCLYYNFVNHGCGLEFRGGTLSKTFNFDNYESIVIKVEKSGK